MKWMGPLLDCSGYASAGRGYVRAATKAGIVVQARCRSRSLALKNMGMDDDLIQEYNTLYANDVDNKSPCVQHQVPDQFFINRRTKKSIGYTIFEMTRIPQLWVPFCNNMDEIWTGSQYSKDSFVNSGVKVPIEVIPHAIDTDFFSPEGSHWEINNRRKFAFVSVFDFTERKAWRELLRAYWTAFDGDADVCLILKVFHGDFGEKARIEIVRKISSYRDELGMWARAPILLYGHDIPNKQMPSFYRSADCYVGMSREGFGLPYAEAMACGLACIGPSVGGNRAFMDADNSFLIDYVKNEPISQDMLRFNKMFDGLEWSVHSWEHLSSVMKRVVSDDTRRKEVADLGLKRVRDTLGLDAIGRMLREKLPE
jgi:glycosyltransferase involved in cell wall biosynthesis